MTKTLEIRGKTLSSGQPPLVCTPLVGRTRDALLGETRRVLAKGPDLLEWRVDFFDAIGATAEVLAVAREIRHLAGQTPLLFTRRSQQEGGEPIALSEEQVVALYTAVCADGQVDLVDVEMNNDPAHVQQVRAAAQAHGVRLILSYHNFQATPDADFIRQRFEQAERQQADIGKVAVMPNSLDDVLTLLTSTLHASRTREIPLISMSMGSYGALSRLFGWVFGSTVTFAVGERSSAPGQVPIAELTTAIEIVRKALAGTQPT